ncbi:hypothetical protein DYH09_06810 [bacterium CPR1]|jgi:hypothetical protein|nr:hypothetical protein [bacterium CPR1]
MTLDFAFLCDYADATGKVNALGIGVDSIYAPQVPARHPQFFVVVQMRASVVEAGARSFTVCLIDADGRSLLEQNGQFELARPVGGTETNARLVMGFYNVEFPRFGRYSFHIAVDRTELVRIPLNVLPIPGAG